MGQKEIKKFIIELDEAVTGVDRRVIEKVFNSMLAWRKKYVSCKETLTTYVKVNDLALTEEQIDELAEYMDSWVDERVIYYVTHFNQSIKGYHYWKQQNKTKKT